MELPRWENIPISLLDSDSFLLNYYGITKKDKINGRLPMPE